MQNLAKTATLCREYPVVPIHADDTSADSWACKASSSSIVGKALMQLQCTSMINNLLGTNMKHINRKDNVIPTIYQDMSKPTKNYATFNT
eukprot:2971997-Ditylum_brightwellii.AAC.1